MNISDLLALIPQDSDDEALRAIEYITTFPSKREIRIRCHLTHPFFFFARLNHDNSITLHAEKWPCVVCERDRFIQSMCVFIREINEAISENRYRKTPLKARLIDLPNPPPYQRSESMKDLYSISGLLPAQFRTDQASNGIGWTTINAKIIEPEQAKPEELPEVSGDDYASKPTKIKLGDFVQVNRDYRNLFGDELIPGGIYRVRKVFSNVSIRLSDTLEKSYIAPNYVRKIDFKIGTRVCTIGAVTPPGLNESQKVSGSGVVTNISSIKNGEKFSCVIHFDEIDDLWWLSEGQFTLDE